MPAQQGRPRKGDRRIDACIDHFAFKGYAARDVRAVVAGLLKVYGGPDAWQFLEEGCYQVVQERLLEIEDEEKQKLQQDGQQVENEPPPQVPARLLQNMVAKVGTDVCRQVLIRWSGMPSALANWEDFFLDKTWEELEALRQCFPHAPAWGQAGRYQGVDGSSCTTQPPSSENIEHDVSEATPCDVAQGTEAEHGPRCGTRERRPSTRVQGPEWV